MEELCDTKPRRTSFLFNRVPENVIIDVKDDILDFLSSFRIKTENLNSKLRDIIIDLHVNSIANLCETNNIIIRYKIEVNKSKIFIPRKRHKLIRKVGNFFDKRKQLIKSKSEPRSTKISHSTYVRKSSLDINKNYSVSYINTTPPPKKLLRTSTILSTNQIIKSKSENLNKIREIDITIIVVDQISHLIILEKDLDSFIRYCISDPFSISTYTTQYTVYKKSQFLTFVDNKQYFGGLSDYIPYYFHSDVMINNLLTLYFNLKRE